jgi:hypothetical protein
MQYVENTGRLVRVGIGWSVTIDVRGRELGLRFAF